MLAFRTAASTALRSCSGGGIFSRASRSAGACLSGVPPADASHDGNNPIPNFLCRQQQFRSIITCAAPRPPIGGGLLDLTSSLAALGISASPATALTTTVTTPAPTPVAIQSRTFASKRFHRKKIIKAAKGYRGQANRNFRAAIKRVERARQNAYRDRRLRRREFRKLWIQRLNAGVRQHGVRYSRFINMLNGSEVRLDRKILSELAMHEPFSFKAVVDVVKSRSLDPQQRSTSG